MWGDQTWAHGYWAVPGATWRRSFPALYNNSSQYAPPHSNRSFRSDHPGGVQFLLVDGSVQFITDRFVARCSPALVTRAGEEPDTTSTENARFPCEEIMLPINMSDYRYPPLAV